ncbi:MAG: glutathione S-transferase family protein [Oricola sp.]|nr:MAG: glutathione S-transferase family protein [Oricola sp.]
MTSLVLYDARGVPSPRRVKMCLHEKQLSYQIRWLDLGLMEQKRPDFLVLNPTGLVPVLQHDGHTLYDSNAINEYLDEVFPFPSLVPSDAMGKAKMRMWFAFEADWARPFRDIVYETLAKDRVRNADLPIEAIVNTIHVHGTNPVYTQIVEKLYHAPTNKDLVEEQRQLIFEKLSGMERALEDGRHWLCGTDFTLADICLAPRLAMLPAIGVDDLGARYPAIAAFLKRIAERDCWAASDVQPKAGETARMMSSPRLSVAM